MGTDALEPVLGQDWLEDIRRNFLALEGYAQPVKSYFVDNVAGDADFGGETWEDAFAEPSDAITAWEAKRLLLNDPTYRARIYMRGTEDPYAAITALPSYCDIVGVGADPRGNGAGIPRIGLDTGTGGGLTGTASARGLNIYNIQFQAGNANYAFQAANLFRSKIVNCTFGTNGSPVSTPAAAFDLGKASGLVIDNCMWINMSGKLAAPLVGINITSTHFHQSEIKNCYIGGINFGIVIAAGCVNAWGSKIHDNIIGPLGQTLAVGVDDNATEGHIIYADNDIAATVGGQLAHNHTLRWIRNWTGVTADTASNE